jgi:hypothetical protein
VRTLRRLRIERGDRMNQRNGNFILLGTGLVVPLQQNVVVVKRFDDSSDKGSGRCGDSVTGLESGHVVERTGSVNSPPNIGGVR